DEADAGAAGGVPRGARAPPVPPARLRRGRHFPPYLRGMDEAGRAAVASPVRGVLPHGKKGAGRGACALLAGVPGGALARVFARYQKGGGAPLIRQIRQHGKKGGGAPRLGKFGTY